MNAGSDDTAPRSRWDRVHRDVVAKALGEFSHERLLAPTPTADGHYEVHLGATTYRFAAERLPLDHWEVDPASVRCRRDDVDREVDAQQVIVDLRAVLGIPDDDLPEYLAELGATLYGRVGAHGPDSPTVRDLLAADLQRTEAAMVEGHPGFVLNGGRVGFSRSDRYRYAPEHAAPVRLVWTAVRREHAHLATGAGLSYEALLAGEFDDDERDGLEAAMTRRGLRPDDHLLLPVHPWQWDAVVALTHAPEIGRGAIVHLAQGRDRYQVQQSVRTLFNRSRPERHYVKTALSIRNMGFSRGMSADYMAGTPAVNDWVASTVADDPTLAGLGFGLLREVASVGYRSPVYDRFRGSAPSKALAALWRESPVTRAGAGERLVTMASLLHRDAAGGSYAAALVRASGLDPRVWLARYLDAYLVPLLHCFYAHELAFMPHGENVVLVLRDHTPVRAIVKDIGEEVAVFAPELDLPPAVERIRAAGVDPALQLSCVTTDVLDGFLRFLAARLHQAQVVTVGTFWRVVAERCEAYTAAHPALGDRFRRHDLFAPTFPLSCLNRLQLRNLRQMVDLGDPDSALEHHGELVNPLVVAPGVR